MKRMMAYLLVLVSTAIFVAGVPAQTITFRGGQTLQLGKSPRTNNSQQDHGHVHEDGGHQHNSVNQQQPVRQYRLRTGNLESNATFDGHHLSINDGTTIYRYSRMETLDSADHQYLGFHNQTLNKTIRFPVAGNGRVQVSGAYGNWNWSQMSVTLVQPNTRPQSVHEIIDALALSIQRKAKEIGNEVALHYQNTPQYRHLAADASEIVTRSTHLHEVAHNHGSIDHMAADLRKLDESFHHLEETFDRVEAAAALGSGLVIGDTTHVRHELASMENEIHQLRSGVESLQSRVVTLKPAFGQFANIAGLSQQLETISNDFLLDLHHNYSHNIGFKETYAEAYEILTDAQYIRSVANNNHNHSAIQGKLSEMCGLVHHLEEDIQGWTRAGHQQARFTSLPQKLEGVSTSVHELMADAGVNCSAQAQAPAPSSGIAPPPGFAPRP